MPAALPLAQSLSAAGGLAPAELPIKVLLADDHRQARQRLRRLIEAGSDIRIVAEAGDLFTALRHVKGHYPHVLVLALQSPSEASIDAIQRLRNEAPATEIIVVAGEDSPAFVRRALDAGALGYVHEGDVGELQAAVRRAARGEGYVSPCVAARLEALRRAVTGDGLSERETEVLRLTALGFTSAEISERIHLSKRTVESYRLRIHHKLGLSKRSELVRYALAHHLIGE